MQGYLRGERMLCTQLNINAHWLLMEVGEMDVIPQKAQPPQEIDKVIKELKPEQRQEVLTRCLEMKKMNEMEERLKKLQEKLDFKTEK